MQGLRILVIVAWLLGSVGAEAATNLQQVNTTSRQTLQNKTHDNTNVFNGVAINSPVLSGTVTGSYSFGGNAILLSPTFDSPIFSGTATGTYTLGGAVTLSSPAILTPTLSGGGVLGGTYSGTYTFATPTISTPVFSGGGTLDGTYTGTYTLAGVGTLTSLAIASPTFSGTAGGSLTNLSLTTPVLANGTVTADPSVDLGIASKQYADQHGFSTGDVKLTLKTTADTSWIFMNDTSIGDVSSGATGRADPDTLALYTLIWTNISDSWAPVAGGRGVSAAQDFSDQKPLMLPKTLGRALAGYGVGTVVATGGDAEVDLTANTLTVASNNTKWVTGMPVVFTLQSGTITGLTTSTTYYVIRNSATLIKLATTLANAQNGTAIDLTAKAAPVWTVTHTYTARVLGEAVGEETHAQSSTELLAHTHTYTTPAAASLGSTTGANPHADIGGSPATSATGGNAAMNQLQPTIFMNVMIKL